MSSLLKKNKTLHLFRTGGYLSTFTRRFIREHNSLKPDYYLVFYSLIDIVQLLLSSDSISPSDSSYRTLLITQNTLCTMSHSVTLPPTNSFFKQSENPVMTCDLRLRVCRCPCCSNKTVFPRRDSDHDQTRECVQNEIPFFHLMYLSILAIKVFAAVRNIRVNLTRRLSKCFSLFQLLFFVFK